MTKTSKTDGDRNETSLSLLGLTFLNLHCKDVSMDAETARRLLDKYRLTRFQKDVLVATAAIPKGETRTYKQIAVTVHRPKAYRAVGSVMRMNPLAPKIPCHRVVRGDGIGNYSGTGGSRTKKRMLIDEGALPTS